MSAIKPRAETEPETAPKRTVPLPDGTPPSGMPPVERPRRRRRVPLPLVILLVLLVMVGSAFWTASRAVYFVGADEDRGNVVTIYRGLPIDLPFGVKLYSRFAGSGVTLESVPPARRATFTNHKLRSKDDAENLVIQLERGQLDS
jgi:protein phosphatase